MWTLRSETDQTALHVAAYYPGGVEAIRALIEAGADVNAQNECGRTPLHEAAWAPGQDEDVKALLDAGSDPTVEDQEGKTPLDVALEQGHDDAAKELVLAAIASGVDVNAKDIATIRRSSVCVPSCSHGTWSFSRG